MNIELDELLAEHIMGWEAAYIPGRTPDEFKDVPVFNRFFNSGPDDWDGVHVLRERGEAFTLWSPTSNDSHALEAAAALLRTNPHYRMRLWHERRAPRNVRPGWKCTFLDRQDDIYRHGEPSIALAISLALKDFATDAITFHPSLDIP